jgi:hypothetical protein
MIQLLEKFSLRRIMIVFLIILVPPTAISINNASWAEPIRANAKAYVEPVLVATTAIVTSINVKGLLQNAWKHPRI